MTTINGCYCLCFGLKAELPGHMVISANDVISSMRFGVVDRLLVSLPLPATAGFTVELTPDLSLFDGQLEEGFVAVTRHSLNFELFDTGAAIRFVYASQRLFAGEQSWLVDVGMNVECEEASQGDVCRICLQNVADVAIAPCGHLVICNDCLCQKGVRLHHCPVCNEISTF
jgi:hypothetical protein